MKGSGVGTFTGGEGISTFRIFIGATLTGAVAEVMCFGKNTKEIENIKYSIFDEQELRSIKNELK